MRRRAYLTGSVGLVGILAGCTGALDGSNDSESADDRSPAATIEAFYEALQNGDAQAMRSFFHPRDGLQLLSDWHITSAQQNNLQFEKAIVIDEGEEEATVRATVSREWANDKRASHPYDFLLRRHDGEWKIYDSSYRARPAPPAAQVEWDVTERTENGAVTAVVFEHIAGDAIDSSTLGARAGGGNVGSPEPASDVTAGTAVVVPFDDEGTTVGSDSTVDLTWADPEGGRWWGLASLTLTSDTAGSPAEHLRFE